MQDRFRTLANKKEIAEMRNRLIAELGPCDGINGDVLTQCAQNLAHIVVTRGETINILRELLTLQTNRLLMVRGLGILSDDQIEMVTGGAAGPELRALL